MDELIKNKTPGINELDEACKSHDIIYTHIKDPDGRADADRELAKIAAKRLTSPTATSDEKTAAFLTGIAMSYKTKLLPNEDDPLVAFLIYANNVTVAEMNLSELKRFDSETIADNRKRAEQHKTFMTAIREKDAENGYTNDDLSVWGVIAESIVNLQLPPSYKYCSNFVGTKFIERLEKKIKPLNKLDDACKSHDIVYEYIKDDIERAKADLQLAKDAIKIWEDTSSSQQDKHDAMILAHAMAYKVAPHHKGGVLQSETTRAINSVQEIIDSLRIGQAYLKSLEKLKPEKRKGLYELFLERSLGFTRIDSQ